MTRLNINVQIKEVPTEHFKHLLTALNPRNSKSVQMGWWGTQNPSGVPDAQVAAWVEEGHPNGGMFAGTYTPPRPVIRTDWQPKTKEKMSHLSEQIRQAFESGSWEAFYNSLGKEFSEDLTQAILRYSKVPNRPSTVKIKGFNNPWVDTGTVARNVQYKVVPFGGEDGK